MQMCAISFLAGSVVCVYGLNVIYDLVIVKIMYPDNDQCSCARSLDGHIVEVEAQTS